MSDLKQLRRLVISENKLVDLNDLSPILTLPCILELQCDKNPVALDAIYRALVISKLKSLKLLDGRRIKEEERRALSKLSKRTPEQKKADMEAQKLMGKEAMFSKIDEIWQLQKNGKQAKKVSKPLKSAMRRSSTTSRPGSSRVSVATRPYSSMDYSTSRPGSSRGLASSKTSNLVSDLNGAMGSYFEFQDGKLDM
jgi:hypothetical protein